MGVLLDNQTRYKSDDNNSRTGLSTQIGHEHKHEVHKKPAGGGAAGIKTMKNENCCPHMMDDGTL